MGSSPGFGSNPDNLPDIVETLTPASVSHVPRATAGFTPTEVGAAPVKAATESCETSPSGFISAQLRPIRTRFRFGSGTLVP